MSIIAFRHLYAVDRICLAISYRDGTSSEVHEEMAGWQSLVDSLPERLPGCMPFASWFNTVALPAFETNPTKIFERAPETPYR